MPPMERALGRKVLDHEVPPNVDPYGGSAFFLTLCCHVRGKNQLCLPGVGEALLEAARFYVTQGRWQPLIFLLMPDHVHALVRFEGKDEMTKVVTAWKRYTAHRCGIRWQQGFFEHRLRTEGSAREKWLYIRQNPVRARLVEDAAAWPYVWTTM